MLSGCGWTGTPAGVTPPDPAALVATDVAQTLAALTPGPTVSLTTQASPTAQPNFTPTTSPTPTPQPTVPTATQPATVTAPAVPTAAPAPLLSPTTAPTSSPAASNPQSTPTGSLSSPSTETCIDKAGFFGDVTVPDDTLVKLNQKFTKTWRIRNEGTCTWDGYQLVFAGGSILNGPQAVPLARAAPGDIIEVSVDLKAPAQGGKYVSDWVFQNSAGKHFGVNSAGQDDIWAKISVDWGPGGNPTPPPPNCAYNSNPAYISQLLALINTARSGKSLKPLTLQSQLSAAATVHSVDMACNNFIDHTGSDGSNWFTRIKAQGYAYSYASENIYVGDPSFGGDAQGAFTWWMNSQVHRDNILSDKISQIGIGYIYFSGSMYGGYYTLDFARP